MGTDPISQQEPPRFERINRKTLEPTHTLAGWPAVSRRWRRLCWWRRRLEYGGKTYDGTELLVAIREDALRARELLASRFQLLAHFLQKLLHVLHALLKRQPVETLAAKLTEKLRSPA